MAKEYSPFTPGVPVPVEFFVGREQEIKELLDRVKKSVETKSLERVFIAGDRGIGKSSLCSATMFIAEEQSKVLGLHVYLGGVSNLEEMIRRVFETLLQESRSQSWFGKIKSFLGNHVREVGLFGITLAFEATSRDLQQAVSDFGSVLRELMRELSDHRKGILLILDDLNGLAAQPEFANWLKSLVDGIATSRQRLPMTLVLCGLPERRRQLINSQPSLDRVFDLISVKPFSKVETRQFYETSFEKIGMTVSHEAHETMWIFSGGYPVFLHEIGHAVYMVDEDNHVTQDDANRGVHSAVRVIGEKYIEPKILDAIHSQRYRGILKKIHLTPHQVSFTKGELQNHLSSDEIKGLSNFLHKMKKLGVIQQDGEMERGEYRFANALYALFFISQSSAPLRP